MLCGRRHAYFCRVLPERGLLQGRPLLPTGWGAGEELTKSWPTSEQLCVQNLALAISCCFSPAKSMYNIRLVRSWPRVGHGLANFWHEHFRVEIAGVFLAVVLWQHPILVRFLRMCTVVLGLTEVGEGVWNPWASKPQISKFARLQSYEFTKTRKDWEWPGKSKWGA